MNNKEKSCQESWRRWHSAIDSDLIPEIVPIWGQAFSEGWESSKKEFPNLRPVIDWLENGCDPKEAAKELRIYQQQMRNV
jgi:hypothetical protein